MRVNTVEIRNSSMDLPAIRRKNTRRTLASANLKRPPRPDSPSLPQIRASSSITMTRKNPITIMEENLTNDRETPGIFRSDLNLLKSSKQVVRDRKRNSTIMDRYASTKYISQAINADEDGNFGETMDQLGSKYDAKLLRLPSVNRTSRRSECQEVVDENDEDGLSSEDRS